MVIKIRNPYFIGLLANQTGHVTGSPEEWYLAQGLQGHARPTEWCLAHGLRGFARPTE